VDKNPHLQQDEQSLFFSKKIYIKALLISGINSPVIPASNNKECV